MRIVSIALSVAAVVIVLAAPAAQAELIPLDLAITGSVEHVPQLLGENWTSSGHMSVRQGGVWADWNYLQELTVGGNPFLWSLSSTGDRINLDAYNYGNIGGQSDSSLVYRVELVMEFENTSPVATYRVTMGVVYSHWARTRDDFPPSYPPDSRMHSWFVLKSDTWLALMSPGGTTLVSSAISADTMTGNYLNFEDLDTFGGLVSDSATHSIVLDLPPGSVTPISGGWLTMGELDANSIYAYTDSSLKVDLTLDDVELIHTIPEPTTLAFFGLGLAGLVAWRRKRWKAA